MARPRRRTRPGVSLFPFLSVLACVMGTLVLLITASATSQVAAGAIDVERFEELQAQIGSRREQLARLSGLEEELRGLSTELEQARAREERLREQSEALGEESAGLASAREALREAESRTAKLESQLEPLRAANARTRQAVEEREAAAVAPIAVRPAGSGLGLEPHFVECRPEELVLYEGLGRTPRAIPRTLVAGSPEYSRFLRDVLFRSNASVIFLIREGGAGTCEAARRQARQHRVRFGEMPLVGDGPLDFSAFGGRS